jgi:hypothetical protein
VAKAAFAAFSSLNPEWRHSAMLANTETHALCQAKAPIAAPVALNARMAAKLANWRDRAMVAKLAAAYARVQDDEGAARLLGVTVVPRCHILRKGSRWSRQRGRLDMGVRTTTFGGVSVDLSGSYNGIGSKGYDA